MFNVLKDKASIKAALAIKGKLKYLTEYAKMSDVDAVRYLTEMDKNSRNTRNMLMGAAALPMGAALLGVSAAGIQKAEELAKHMGLRNPLDQMIIDRALKKVLGRSPEIKSMDQEKIKERCRMLYSSSPILFEPENTEVLENILLNMRSFNGADYKLLKEISQTDSEVRKQRNMGATAKDLANIGNLMIR